MERFLVRLVSGDRRLHKVCRLLRQPVIRRSVFFVYKIRKKDNLDELIQTIHNFDCVLYTDYYEHNLPSCDLEDRLHFQYRIVWTYVNKLHTPVEIHITPMHNYTSTSSIPRGYHDTRYPPKSVLYSRIKKLVQTIKRRMLLCLV